jgi:hypothetical protein
MSEVVVTTSTQSAITPNNVQIRNVTSDVKVRSIIRYNITLNAGYDDYEYLYERWLKEGGY